jgi:hypothetical protein
MGVIITTINTTPKKQLCTGLDKAMEETTAASSVEIETVTAPC